jgi:hypothetical protein
MKNTEMVLIFKRNVIITEPYGYNAICIPRAAWADIAAHINAAPTDFLLPVGFVIPVDLPQLPEGVDMLYYNPQSEESFAIVENGDTYRYNAPFSFCNIVTSGEIVGSSHHTVVRALIEGFDWWANS